MESEDTEYPSRAAHSIGLRRFLGYTFEISSDDADVARYVGSLFDSFDAPADDADVHPIVLLTKTPDKTDVLVIDGKKETTEAMPGRIVSAVVHALTRRMIEDSDALGVHAGGVVRGDAAIALPAQMESGKSTLTAGLVRAGFSYLTDEAVMFDWDGLTVIPFPKPISLDPGSWSLFPELEPDAPLPIGFKDEQWHVPPDAIRPGSVAAPCRITHLVFPKYTEGVTTRLTRLGRAEGTIELAKNTFRFNERSRRSLDALAAVVQETDCYRLEVGNLERAVELVGELATQSP